MNDKRVDITIVLPVYNEAQSISETLKIVVDHLEQIKHSWEIFVIDDGSRDNTFEIIKMIAHSDKRIKSIRLSRNFGKESALLAGMKYANGDAVITMDADLQHPPHLL